VETWEISAREISSCYEEDDQRCRNSMGICQRHPRLRQAEGTLTREHKDTGNDKGSTRKATGFSVGLLLESSVVTPGGKDTDKDGTTTVTRAHHPYRKDTPKETQTTPEGYLRESPTIPQGYPKDTQEIPQGHPKDTPVMPQRIPKNTPRIHEGRPKDTPMKPQGYRPGTLRSKV